MTKKKASKKTKIEGDEIPSLADGIAANLKEIKEDIKKALPVVEVVDPIEAGEEMNVLAMRIWRGQSISLPTGERVKRIKARLTEKGYDISTLKLPVEDKYLG